MPLRRLLALLPFRAKECTKEDILKQEDQPSSTIGGDQFIDYGGHIQ